MGWILRPQFIIDLVPQPLSIAGLILFMSAGALGQQTSLVPSGMDGHLLDQSLSTIDGVYNRSRQSNIGFTIGNAIVTGNIGGGRGFRGELGYRASRDFRGATPIDLFDSYRFDTLQSGLSLQRITTRPGNPQIGNPLSTTFTNPVLASSSSGTTLSQVTRYGQTYEPPTFDAGGTLGSFQYNRTQQGILGARPGETGVPRRGPQGRPMISPGTRGPAAGLDAGLELDSGRQIPKIQAPRNRLEPKTGAPKEAEKVEAGESGPKRPTGISVGKDAYTDLMARMAQTATQSGAAPVSGEYTAEQLAAIQEFRNALRTVTAPGGDAEKQSAPNNAAPVSSLTPERLREIAARLPKIDRLAGTGRSLVNDAMARGEEALLRGEYFAAEEQFSRALMISVDEPMALAGRMHAQIGAGLYQSASVSLRRLLTNYPEMAGAEFEAVLIPKTERLAAARADLARLRSVEGMEDGALLEAYIGRLLGDPVLIAQAVDAMRAHDPNDPILTTIEVLWQTRQ